MTFRKLTPVPPKPRKKIKPAVPAHKARKPQPAPRPTHHR
ncbi:MAG: hypothetical protein QOE54_2617 [Streptosporangiaceae bacterium]|jgi:hypothetical protein|nr:hypothetical protein [Streptosporangiaceae bacterium]MDX6430251.1 hypothetical protein [Streptosporangiaceae bacterium]